MIRPLRLMEICCDWHISVIRRWGWGGLSPSAGGAALSMRSETTTNSAPPAAVTLSKQRPRLSLRIIHRINPIKTLSLYRLGIDRRRGIHAVWKFSPWKASDRAHEHPLRDAARCAHRQLLPRTSAKPMFTFTNPPPWQKHSNIVKTTDSLQLEGPLLKSPVATVTF